MTCSAVLAQVIAPAKSPGAVAADEVSAAGAQEIIFSNLDPSPDDRYNNNQFLVFPVTGKDASGETENWDAIMFIPKLDVQAKELSAAISYISGTKLVNLGIYSNNDITGSVGTPLPGGQASTSEMPDNGACCQLAKVTLPGHGVLLTAGTIYWLVASPDNTIAPTFRGAWHLSNRATDAALASGFPWTANPGQWPAAQIRGTKVQALNPANVGQISHRGDASTARVTIFTNLGPSSTDRYDFNEGVPIRGSSVPFQPEISFALPFMPKANVHAKTLGAAIGYVAGTKKVNLGIYNDSGGTPGALLPGGQGSTTDIPDFQDCCELAQVTLPGAGAGLIKGTQYWLVANTDDIDAPDFSGFWSSSNLAVSAYQEPEFFINWTSFSGGWLAARIEGTNP